jgi:DNA-binding response OmpR family regulator
MRLLIVQGDQTIRENLARHFEAATFAVDSTECGEHGCMLARTNDYDLIILDYLLPKKTGCEIVHNLRSFGRTAPIIMLTERSATIEKINAFNAGIDDYVTKPFSLQELHARVRALLRRPRTYHSPILSIANLTIDTNRQSVILGTRKVYLTRKEFALLEYLARNKCLVISKSMILEHVWDAQGDPFSNTIEAHILNLRKKLSFGNKKLIHTIPGRGYKLDTAA